MDLRIDSEHDVTLLSEKQWQKQIADHRADAVRDANKMLLVRGEGIGAALATLTIIAVALIWHLCQ